MLDIKLALMTGVDIPIPECQLVMHQPTIKEISMIGEKIFFSGIQTLCIDKNLLISMGIEKAQIYNISTFEILTQFLQSEPEKKQYIKDVLIIMFPRYRVNLTPRALVFTETSSNTTVSVSDDNFEIFQATIKQVMRLQSDTNSFNPVGAKAQEIAEKLYRARQRVAAQKQNDGGESSLSQYISSLTIGVASMALTEVINLTIYQLYDLLERYGLYTGWDLDVRCRLAGGKADTKPENWMKPLH